MLRGLHCVYESRFDFRQPKQNFLSCFCNLLCGLDPTIKIVDPRLYWHGPMIVEIRVRIRLLLPNRMDGWKRLGDN